LLRLIPAQRPGSEAACRVSLSHLRSVVRPTYDMARQTEVTWVNNDGWRGCVRELIDRLDRLYSYGFGDLPITAASVFTVSDEIVAQKSRRMDQQGAVLQITPWERDVLQLLADGRATNEIATHLGMRTPDFESGLTRLFAAMGAATRAEAIAGALKRGLLT
jgi:DNA-binding CsgD family transcriptional regulator